MYGLTYSLYHPRGLGECESYSVIVFIYTKVMINLVSTPVSIDYLL